MDENFKTILAVLSCMIVILAVFLLITGNIYPEGLETLGIDTNSTYSYEVDLASSGTLYNVTLFLPLPSYSGNSPVGYGIFEGGSGWGLPENMVTDIFGDGDSLFLKVTIPETNGFNFGITVEAGGVIDTLNPLENSYIISPVYDLESGEKSDIYNTYIYASYDSSPATTVNIDLSETGRNSWEVFSKKTNYFEEKSSLTLTESPDKWQTAEVSVSKGNGDYSVLF